MAKRRSKGEGSLYFDAREDRWVGQFTLPDGRRKSKTSKDKKEVLNWLAEMRVKANRSITPADDNITVGSHLDHYITDVASHTLKPSTLRSYKYLIRDHIKPDIGRIKLIALRPEHLQSLYRKKLDEGLSGRTVQYIHAVIRRALNQAMKWERIYRNPSDVVSAPRPKKKQYRTLSTQEAQTFFEQVKDHPYFSLYLIATLMGLRKSEILGLHWEDVDFKQSTISINRTISEIQGKIVESTPKTKSSRRTVSMPELVKEALARYQEETGKIAGLIFTTSTGKPISQRNLTRHFHANLERAGLPRIRFHDLRHTAATLLLKENVHPKIVQSMLGHASIVQTLDTYSHVIPSVGKKAADKMDELFKP